MVMRSGSFSAEDLTGPASRLNLTMYVANAALPLAIHFSHDYWHTGLSLDETTPHPNIRHLAARDIPRVESRMLTGVEDRTPSWVSYAGRPRKFTMRILADRRKLAVYVSSYRKPR